MSPSWWVGDARAWQHGFDRGVAVTNPLRWPLQTPEWRVIMALRPLHRVLKRAVRLITTHRCGRSWTAAMWRVVTRDQLTIQSIVRRRRQSGVNRDEAAPPS